MGSEIDIGALDGYWGLKLRLGHEIDIWARDKRMGSEVGI